MFVLFGAIVLSVLSSTAFGQTYTVDPIAVSKCPVQGDHEIDLEVGLKEEADGSKYLSLKSNLDMVLDEECTYVTNVDMNNGGTFIRYMNDNRGTVCESLDSILQPAWARFRQELDPPVAGCTFNPSTLYSLGGFKVNKDEVNLPLGEGHFRSDMHMFCNKKEIACVLAEFKMIQEDR